MAVDLMKYASQFQDCVRVKYNAYACKAPVGSVVLDPVVDWKAIVFLHGRTFLTNKEALEIQKAGGELWSLISGRVLGDSDYVLNINGVLSLVSLDELCRDYKFGDSRPITENDLMRKSYIIENQNGVDVPVDITLARACSKARKDEAFVVKRKHVIPWFSVVWAGNLKENVLFIDRGRMPEFRWHYLSNDKAYVVIVANGDVSTAKVISLDDFMYRYNLRGRKLDYNRVPMKIPKPLFELSKSTRGAKTFALVVYNIIKDLQVSSLSERGGGMIKDVTISSDNCVVINYWGTTLIAYCKDARYYLFHVNVELPEPVEKQLPALEHDRYMLLCEADFKTYRELFIAFLSLAHGSVVSSYYNAPLSVNELESLKRYSGEGYRRINDFVKGMKTDNDFKAYLQASFIQNVIDWCTIRRNQYHFRGVKVKLEDFANFKEGFVLKSSAFVSTSLVSGVAFNFMGVQFEGRVNVLLVFKNTRNKHGFYLDNCSAFRDTEFEVLFGVGTNFRLVRKLGYYHVYNEPAYDVWLCEMQDDPTVELRRYRYEKDVLEELLFKVRYSDLMKEFYICDAEEGDVSKVTLKQYGSDSLVITISVDGDKVSATFIGGVECEFSFSKEKDGYDKLFCHIYQVLRKNNVSSHFNDSAFTAFSERFMLDLVSLLLYNNFVISSQTINENYFEGALSLPIPGMKEVTRSIDSRVSKLTILNARSLPLEFKFELTTDYKSVIVKLAAFEDGEYVGRAKYGVPIADRGTLFEKVYQMIVTKFGLNPIRRLKRIFSLVFGFYEQGVKCVGSEDRYEFYNGDKVFVVNLVGTSVTVSYYGNVININYYDDVYESASKIQAMI